MIASDRTALQVGTAKLVVDGTDTTLVRKAEISLSPGRVRSRALDHLLDLSREVYNASLQHRRAAWKMARVRISRFDQFNEIPELRVLRPDLLRFGNQFIGGAISRADEAFGAFFGRLADHQTPGYPRFKSAGRFRTVFYDEPTNWQLKGIGGDRPVLIVKGVGEIGLRPSAARQLARLMDQGGEAPDAHHHQDPLGGLAGRRGVRWGGHGAS